MIKALLGIDSSQDIVGLDVYFRSGWFLGLVLVAVGVGFGIYLYRSERDLPGRWRNWLAVFQIAALLLLIVMVLRPVAEYKLAKQQRAAILVLLDTSESMGTEDRRQSDQDLEEVAAVMGIEKGKVKPVSRGALAKAALEHPKFKMVEKLEEQFDVRFFTFDDQLRPQGDVERSEGDGQGGVQRVTYRWLDGQESKGMTSQVGSAIDGAVGRYAGQPIAGVVVLSDFTWIKGKDPVMVTRELKGEQIPVYPVVIGMSAPPDIRVRKVLGPKVVFKDDKIPLRVQIDSKGFEGRTADLVMYVDGDESGAARKQITLTGDVQFEQFMFAPTKDSGNIQLKFAIDGMNGEATEANNSAPHKVRVLDEKIKVLYIEGMPRWEYRYLRWVLLRDKRLDVTFLMTQGDPELARTSSQHLGKFPDDVKSTFKYDLIILGDVHYNYFKASQRKLIDDHVRKSGGSLLMVAGPMAAPTSYRGKELEKLLPENVGRGGWQGVSGQAHPVVTPEGRDSQVTALADTEELTDRIWSRVRPMYRLPPLNGAKPGATVLLSLPSETPEVRGYPLVAWQPVGSGKTMFVGTEDLWRMRLEVGNRYHARFWGQTIQFLTLARLLGENKQIGLQTDKEAYNSGDQVKLFANVMTEEFEPVEQESFQVVIEKVGEADSEVDVELTKIPQSPGLYSGVQLAGAPGQYRLKVGGGDSSLANVIEFDVVSVPLEKRETGASWDVAEQIAQVNGGKALRLTGMEGLPDSFKDHKPLTAQVKMERELWDVPWIFILLVIVTGLEWYFRRRHNLV